MDNSFLDKDYIQEISVSSAIQENTDRILELEKESFELRDRVLRYENYINRVTIEINTLRENVRSLQSILTASFIGFIFLLLLVASIFSWRIANIIKTYIPTTTVVSVAEPETTVATTTAKAETKAAKDVEETTTKKQRYKNIINYFDVPLSEDLQNHIFHLCSNYEINPAVVIAMIERESNFKAKAIGDNGQSYGLMQIQPKWKENKERMQRLNCPDLLDPYQNVTVGIDILAEHLDRGKGLTWALMAYNSGASKANQHAKNGVVTDYARDVIARSEKISGQKG